MTDWKVRLNGEESGLEILSEIYTEDPEVLEEDGSYYLYYSKFDGYEEAREVRSEAEDVRDKIWGVSQVRFNLTGKPTIRAVIPLKKDDHSGHIFLTLREKPEIDEDSSEFINDLLALAEKDPRAATLSRILSNGYNWVNLYRIYEFIQDNLDPEDDENIYEKGWISKSDGNRFTHTANSIEILGEEARHGRRLNTPPDDPMDKSTAEGVILELAESYLEYIMLD